jgi:arogenate dehydrogenase (NADP+)
MKIGIVGLGLIGGSLGLDLRSQGHQVMGISRKPATCDRAIARGAVDDASTHPGLLRDADVVFLCTPLGVMQETVAELLPHLSPETVLTDVGSVKGWVVQAISPLWANFVGGHPMAGTAESGIEAAQYNLFVGAPYVLTPIETTPIEAVQRVEDIVRPLQVRLYHCQPEEHDCAVAWISHLPVVASASLITACMQESNPAILDLAKALASSGFRDTSRVGGGNPELGLMMARYNRDALVRSLHAYREVLNQMVEAITREDWATLEETLKQTQTDRPAFMK